jgi:hypothetical protein
MFGQSLNFLRNDKDGKSETFSNLEFGSVSDYWMLRSVKFYYDLDFKIIYTRKRRINSIGPVLVVFSSFV